MIVPGPAGYSYNKVAVAVTDFKYQFCLKRYNPASNDMWGPDEGFMGGKCGPHYGLAPGIHNGASRGSPDVLKVGPVRVLHGS